MSTARQTLTELGENVKIAVEGNELTIKIDLSHRGGISASGKTLRVASTNGNKDVGDGVFLGINAYTYPEVKR